MSSSTIHPVLDPVTVAIAERLPWSYDVVHRWLGRLAALSVRPEFAGELLEACADVGADPELVIDTATAIALEGRLR